MAYCTGRIPALHFYERRLLAYLQLCAKSPLDPVWANSASFCAALASKLLPAAQQQQQQHCVASHCGALCFPIRVIVQCSTARVNYRIVGPPAIVPPVIPRAGR